jgi:hypothetical protein
MKSKLLAIQASAALALLACGGSAAAAPPSPGSDLPRPEDPVILPTDEQVAQYIKNVRESELKMLKWDEDGWDDLEVKLVYC